MSSENESKQSSSQHTPGQRLRAARDMLGWSQSDVATKLRLSVQTIKDIEQDDYSHMSALIYVRGYLRSYARAMNQPADEIIGLFDALKIEEPNPYERLLRTENALPISSGPRRGHRAQSNRHWLRWTSLGLVVLLIAMVVMWWQGQKHHLHSQAANTTLSVTSDTPVAPKPSENTLALPTEPTQTPQPLAQQKPKPAVKISQQGSEQTAAQILANQAKDNVKHKAKSKTVSLTPPGKVVPDYQVTSVH